MSSIPTPFPEYESDPRNGGTEHSLDPDQCQTFLAVIQTLFTNFLDHLGNLLGHFGDGYIVDQIGGCILGPFIKNRPGT